MRVTSGRYIDYINEIRTSHKLGDAAYRIAPDNNSPTLILTYNQRVFCLGSKSTIVHEIGSEAITKENYLPYWKEGTRGVDNITKFRGNRGIRGERGAKGDPGA